MRKTLWTLAWCGFASTAFLQAQERTLAPRGTNGSSLTLGRTVAKPTTLKNYSAELFGEEKPALIVAEDPLAKTPAESTEAAEPAAEAESEKIADDKTETTPLSEPASDAVPVSEAVEESAAPEGRVTFTRTRPAVPAAGRVPVALGAASKKSPAEDRPAWADSAAEPEIVSADAEADAEITQVKGELLPAAKPAANRGITASPVAEKPTAAKVTVKPPVKSTVNTRRIETPVDVDAEEPAAESAPVVSRSRVTPTRQAVRQISGTSVSRPVIGETKSTVPAAPLISPVVTQVTAAPQVVTQWKATSAINIGQSSTCELVVKNTGNATAAKVEVEASFPKELRFVSSQPEPSSSELTWTIDELAAGEEKVITLTFVPEVRGAVTPTANVRFSGVSTGSFSVAEPLLAVRLEGASEVLVGETASQTLMISNPGTGIVTNVRIEALIPEGLEHVRGAKLKMDLGNLTPGENRPVRLALTAVAGGHHVIDIHATADHGLNEKTSSEVTVIAPSLSASIEGPSLRYLGRQATYTLKVVNDGAASTDNVRVMHKVPDGFEFVSSEQGVQYDSQNRMLNWFVGRLDKGAESTVPVVLIAKSTGEYTHFIRATSEHGAVSDAEVSTRVEGASSLVVDVSDLDDPVEVGVETAYEIKVKNEGTAAAQNVSLTCELPIGVEFSKATGPVQHKHDKELVVFQPVGEVAVGQELTFQVIVKGTLSGNMRFRTRLTSDSLAEPLASEELTKVYGE